MGEREWPRVRVAIVAGDLLITGCQADDPQEGVPDELDPDPADEAETEGVQED